MPRTTPSSTDPTSANPNQGSHPKRVIILDDCPSMGRRYGQALRDRGLVVTHYTQPKEFLKATQDQQLGNIDMFLIDVMLTHGGTLPVEETANGELEGIRMAQWLQRESKYREVPVMLASASPFSDIVDSAKSVAVALNQEESCNCVFVHKLDYPPAKLSELVTDYFATGTFHVGGTRAASWFKSLFF